MMRCFSGSAAGFEHEAGTHAGVELLTAILHSIRFAISPRHRDFRRQIQNECEVGFQATGDDAADGPQVFRVQPAHLPLIRVPLIDHVRQEEAIRDDDFAAIQAGRITSSTNCARDAMKSIASVVVAMRCSRPKSRSLRSS